MIYLYRLGMICCVVIGCRLFYLGAQEIQAHHWGAWFELSIFFAIDAAAYVALDHFAGVARARWSRPLTAREFESLNRAGHHYALYLRPLHVDARIRTGDTRNPLPGMGLPFMELQEWLIRTASPKWRFLSEGGLTTNVRPTEIVASADWFEDIAKVGSLVHVVVMIPGNTPGVLREMEHFLRTRPHNLIVVVPPREGNEYYFARLDGAEDHELIRCVLMSPEGGALILPFVDGSLKFARYPLDRRGWAKALEARMQGVAA